VTAEGPPVYHFKTVIPLRRAGHVPGIGRDRPLHRLSAHRRLAARLEDVEEIDVIETQLGRSEFVDRNRARAAMEGAHAIERGRAPRTVVDETERQSRTP